MNEKEDSDKGLPFGVERGIYEIKKYTWCR